MGFKKINLPFRIKKPILALGSQTKNTVCWASGNVAHLSSVHSDLSNPKDYLRFENTVGHFLKKNPKIIAYDLHPEYQSTKFTLSLATRYSLLATQHHHAHIASCMADNGLMNQKVIGIAFDGTGLGSDNTLWGAEFFYPCNYKSFRRYAHLKEIPLLGSEAAILEPWRLAAFWLYSIYKEKFWDLNLGLIKKMDEQKWQVLKNMYSANFNSPLASSMGRLFDAVSSLVLAKDKVHFEAELAIELEKLATSYELPALLPPAGEAGSGRRVTSYEFNIVKKEDKYIIEPAPMFKEIIADLKAKEPKEKIAYRFHLTLAQMIKKVCLMLKGKTNINKVVLSGGVFQNNLLLYLTQDLLYKEGFRVFIHKKLSSNDSSISLGQIIIAHNRS